MGVRHFEERFPGLGSSIPDLRTTCLGMRCSIVAWCSARHAARDSLTTHYSGEPQELSCKTESILGYLLHSLDGQHPGETKKKCSLVCAVESSFQGFFAGAGFRPTTVLDYGGI